MSSLQNKIVFITGGASGIGMSCALAYAQAGAQVAVMDRDASALDLLLHQLGETQLSILGDAQYGPDVQKAIDATLDRFGRLDIVHNNVGMSSPSKPLHETTEDEWDALFSINLKSVFWTTRYSLDALKQTKGCILNTSRMVGEIGQLNHAGYVATKGGMNALTKAMALDYAPFGIRVNAICPAGVWTPMLRTWATQQPNPATIETYLNDIHTLGYCPEGDVIADAAVFLVSDAARFMTGCILPVSGGAELGYGRKSAL